MTNWAGGLQMRPWITRPDIIWRQVWLPQSLLTTLILKWHAQNAKNATCFAMKHSTLLKRAKAEFFTMNGWSWEQFAKTRSKQGLQLAASWKSWDSEISTDENCGETLPVCCLYGTLKLVNWIQLDSIGSSQLLPTPLWPRKFGNCENFFSVAKLESIDGHLIVITCQDQAHRSFTLWGFRRLSAGTRHFLRLLKLVANMFNVIYPQARGAAQRFIMKNQLFRVCLGLV